MNDVSRRWSTVQLLKRNCVFTGMEFFLRYVVKREKEKHIFNILPFGGEEMKNEYLIFYPYFWEN